MQKKSKTKEPYVVQYESKKGEYEYARFWDSRSYEDRAERILLRKLLKKYPSEAQWLVDVGGSFGRLLDVYSRKFKEVAIVDYATNEFHLSLEPAKKIGVKLNHIAANAYHLPFANDSQTAFISIRVIHHLTEPEKFFAEIYRSLQPGGIAIIEAANKNSLKRILKCIQQRDFSEWRADWVDIGASGLQEDGVFHLIRNYHPNYLQDRIKESGLEIKKKKTISWFRRTPVTKLPNVVVDLLERLMQSVSGIFFFGPSSWYVVRKPGTVSYKEGAFTDSLTMPPANKKLIASEQKKATKTSRKVKYLDLRYPSPRR